MLKHLATVTLACALGACSASNGDDAGEASGVASDQVASAAPYPIVLAHGFFGFEDFAGIEFINYFYGVKDHLARHGEGRVFTPAVDPFNDSEHRGKQLLAHVERIVRETGASKVNLIGHSQGGLDARYVAHQRPDLVASVTTISSPHRGMPLSDLSLGLVDGPGRATVIDTLVKALGGPLWDEIGNETSLARSMRQFSTPAIERFNAAYPNVPGIPYYSIAGRSQLSLGGADCRSDVSPPWIRRWAWTVDSTEPLFAPMAFAVGGPTWAANDALVPVGAARWGTFLGCIPADHLDQIGHLLDDPAGFGNRWDHKDFYVDLVDYLRDKGL